MDKQYMREVLARTVVEKFNTLQLNFVSTWLKLKIEEEKKIKKQYTQVIDGILEEQGELNKVSLESAAFAGEALAIQLFADYVGEFFRQWQKENESEGNKHINYKVTVESKMPEWMNES